MTAVQTREGPAGVAWSEGPDPTARIAARILHATLVLALAAVALQTLVDLFDFWALDREVELLLADSDLGVFSWGSVAAAAVVAVGALLLSMVDRRRRVLLWFVAASAAYFSLDDQVGLHERMGDLADRAEGLAAWEPARLLWPVLYLPLLAALGLGIWRLAGGFPPRASRFALAGLALLAAAVVLEVVSAGVIRAGYDRGSLLYELEVVAEEGAELAGWILIAGAFLSAFVLGLRPHLRRV
jgi:hypothetical protein